MPCLDLKYRKLEITGRHLAPFIYSTPPVPYLLVYYNFVVYFGLKVNFLGLWLTKEDWNDKSCKFALSGNYSNKIKYHYFIKLRFDC